MTTAVGAALQGWNNAESLLNKAASQIARGPAAVTAANPSSGSATPADTLNLSDSMVALLQARNNGEANLKTIRVADEMDQDLLDILG
jgi:flagellar hook protein FlgE